MKTGSAKVAFAVLAGGFLSSTAGAGTIYFNDVLVDSSDLTGSLFEGVDIRVDDAGQLHIVAPGYIVELLDSPLESDLSAAPDMGPPSAASAPVAPADPALIGQVPRGSWWLVTETLQSSGQEISIWINENLAHTVRSDDAMRALDVGPLLAPGSNQVRVKGVSAGNGALAVYIGKGSARTGSLVLEKTAVTYKLHSSVSGPQERDFMLHVGAQN